MKVMLLGSFSNLNVATIEQNGIRLVFAFGQIGLNIFFRISDVFAARILKKYKDFLSLAILCLHPKTYSAKLYKKILCE